MSGLNHYTNKIGFFAGLAAEDLLNKNILCELISDGIHVNEQLIKIAYNLKGSDKITLITDSINAKGQKNGNYKLGTLEIVKRDFSATLKNNDKILAGSVATFIHCFKTFKRITGANYIEMAKISSLNIAKQLNNS